MKNTTKGTLFMLLAIALIYLVSYLVNASDAIRNAWWHEITCLVTFISIVASLVASFVCFFSENK
jgi:hypothetical protein